MKPEQISLFEGEESTLFVGASHSHANRIAVPESVRLLLTSVISGVNSRGSFASLSQNGCWLKMCAGYLVPNLDGSLDEFSGTWPTWGTLLDGAATELTPLVRHTSEKESLSWRTPQSHNGNQGPKSKEFYERCLQTNESMITLTDQVRHNPGMWPTPHSNCHTGAGTQGRQGGENLQTAVTWPTPTSRDWKSGSATQVEKPRTELLNDRVAYTDGGQLNPAWVEILQGFPQGWTDIGPQDGGQHQKQGVTEIHDKQ